MDSTKQAASLTLARLKPGHFLNLGKVVGGGALEARRLSTGILFYWRYTVNGKTDRLPIGTYDASVAPRTLVRPAGKGYSIKAAEKEAERLANDNRASADCGGIRAVKRQQSKKEATLKAQTFGNLLADYCDYLEALGRKSHSEARSLFSVHVQQPWPEKLTIPAIRISAEDVADMMRSVVAQGKGRTSNKLRSYLRAAFQVAKAARTRASIPIRFKDYDIRANPAADTEGDESFNRADKRPVSLDELREYWYSIRSLGGIRGAVLRLHLLTGGQRIEQLVRLRTSDIDPQLITLYDGKGRPGRQPRPHTVPLTAMASAALRHCGPMGLFALSTDGGLTHIANTTLSRWAVEVATNVVNFKAKRIRSGVETVLASLGISQDVRGRLQSHGISGVQNRHYDGYDYTREKLNALLRLEAALEAQLVPACTTSPNRE